MSPETGWSIKSSITPKHPKVAPLLVDGSGELIWGTGAYLNTKAPGSPRFDIDFRGLRISFNPNKILHPYELAPLDALSEAYNGVEDLGLGLGIQWDAAALRLSRIDLAGQSEMNEPLHVYRDAYHMLSGPRCKVKKEHETGVAIGNRQTQTVFYSKRDELLKSHKNGMGCPDRLLRCEVKWLDHAPATKAFQVTYLHELLSLPTSAFDGAYKDYLNTTVFRSSEGTQTTIPFTELSDLWERCNGKLSRYRAYFEPIGITFVHGGLVGYLDTLRAFGINRMAIHREEKRIREAINVMSELNGARLPVADLFHELKNKFAA